MTYSFLPMDNNYCEKVFDLEKDIFPDHYSLESIISDIDNKSKLS